MTREQLIDRTVKQCIRAAVNRGLSQIEIEALAKQRREAAERLCYDEGRQPQAMMG